MKHFLRVASSVSVILLGAVVLYAAPQQYDSVNVTLPQGDPQAGRRAFIDLKCTVCHHVAGESGLPAPLSESRGPDLGRAVALRPASEVAAAIIVPSHSMSVKTSEEVRKRLQRMLLSPMPDYSRVLTVRQLADLIAYLGSLEHSK